MKAMDTLLGIFFSNFTIITTGKSFVRGSQMSYKLNEPYEGFVSTNDFVLGAALAKLFQTLHSY